MSQISTSSAGIPCTEKINTETTYVIIMAACEEKLIGEDEAAYVREKYLKLQREKDQYVSLDDYCAKRDID